MSPAPIGAVIIAIINPKPGKQSEILELYKPLMAATQSNEPHCRSFQAHTDIEIADNEEIFMVERYVSCSPLLFSVRIGPDEAKTRFLDWESVKFHRTAKELEVLIEELEKRQLLAKPIYTKVVKPVGGFARA